jgi:tetratricopeptide (TPR) repeat protein
MITNSGRNTSPPSNARGTIESTAVTTSSDSLANQTILPEADEELARITSQNRARPYVLEPRWQACAKAGKWDECVDIAGAIIKLNPKRPFGWIHRSFALQELKRTQEAFDQLLPVADRFPKVWLIPYNLACYCAQLGRLDECQRWFKKAMAIDEFSVQRAAVDDPDLKSLREAKNGRPAVAVVKKVHSPLIPTDFAMPLRNGSEATFQILKAATAAKPQRSAPSQALIAQKAYDLWVSEGQEWGYDQKHWFEAELQLQQA